MEARQGAGWVSYQHTDTWYIRGKYDDFVIQVYVPVFDRQIRCGGRRVRYLIATRCQRVEKETVGALKGCVIKQS